MLGLAARFPERATGRMRCASAGFLPELAQSRCRGTRSVATTFVGRVSSGKPLPSIGGRLVNPGP